MLYLVKKRNVVFSEKRNVVFIEKRNVVFSEMVINRVCLVFLFIVWCIIWGYDFIVKYLIYLYRVIDVLVLFGFVLYVLVLF